MITFLFFVMTYIAASCVDFAYYTGNKFWASQAKCVNSKDHTDRLVRLANQTHSILDSMGIEHWLMYGSLWGPLRGIPGPLPWDHDVDFGFDGDGNFSKIPIEEFKARFTEAGLEIANRLQSSSSFLVGGSVEFFVFYNHRRITMRTGYELWLFILIIDFIIHFPPDLSSNRCPRLNLDRLTFLFLEGVWR